MRELSVCCLRFGFIKPQCLGEQDRDFTCSRQTRRDWRLTWMKSWHLTLSSWGLSLWALHKQAEIFLFPKQFYPSELLCALEAAAQAPGCHPSLSAHGTGFVPSITRCHHQGVTSACHGFYHKPWLYFMLQCIQFTRANPFSLGTLHQAAFPDRNGFSNRNKQMQSQSCFLLPAVQEDFFISLAFCPVQGDRPAELKIFVRQFFRIFCFTKHWKDCKGERQSGEFICVTNEGDSSFLAVMKFAKLLMSALVSLSDDLVPVELFHLSC